ncbi:hypothetical protein ABEB36_009578 [Hypothenemus hampei]|uniref:F-box domain-containing protein n=1 Tax=Hypothenemus hampei TaxID=57062 RepID=A0ABD1EGS7_HYPHA
MKRYKIGDMMDNHGECSKPKKSKSCSEQNIHHSRWTQLPSLVLHKIFGYLSPEDRISASSVCQHWRRSLFHPRWWPIMKFKIEHDNIRKAKFYTSNFGHIITEATITLDSLSPICIYEFINLLRLLNQNNRLRSLIIEPSHCRLEGSSSSCINRSGDSDVIEILDLIIAILPRLNAFSLGGLEELANYSDCIVRNLDPLKINLLGLASIKDNLTIYEESHFTPDLISSFKNLQTLSIDYDQLSDQFLYNLKDAKNLQRVVVHLHAVPEKHLGTTNNAWKDFKNAHPRCLLRLTVIHAYVDIKTLHSRVLREDMPLSHIKVFFCEDINLELLHILSTFYSRTLQSVMWIDSLSDMPNSWKLTESDESPDPFVLMSWLCGQFEELILYGYKYFEENLVAIGRLKGTKMKKVQIPSNDIMGDGCKFPFCTDPLKDITTHLQSAWSPIYVEDLHPVILDPNKGDSDEFLIPFVLADLH